jgi:hypothetical protein
MKFRLNIYNWIKISPHLWDLEKAISYKGDFWKNVYKKSKNSQFQTF